MGDEGMDVEVLRLEVDLVVLTVRTVTVGDCGLGEDGGLRSDEEEGDDDRELAFKLT
jgi:hypothetical protein